MFRLNRNKQKTHPNSLKESIFGYFSENLGLFRFVTKQFGLFWLFRCSKHRNKPTFLVFWFHETKRNKPETDLVSVCFGSNRNLFLIVSRTPYSHTKYTYSVTTSRAAASNFCMMRGENAALQIGVDSHECLYNVFQLERNKYLLSPYL
jgi:hypothetical protein